MTHGLSRGAPARALLVAARASRALSVLLLALMAILIVAQVFGRNLFNDGMPWADELARFCGVALVFLCAPMLAIRRAHVAVDFVQHALPPGGRRLATLLCELMTFAFCALWLWALQAFLARAWKFATPTLGIPNWVVYAPAALGFALLALVTLQRILAPSSWDAAPDERAAP